MTWPHGKLRWRKSAPVDAEIEGDKVTDPSAARPASKVVVVGALLLAAVIPAWLLLAPATSPTLDASSAESSAVDTGFLLDMQTHHEQAVVMGHQAQELSSDPVIQRLGALIAGIQETEIAKMATLLTWQGGHPDDSTDAMSWMVETHGLHHSAPRACLNDDESPPMPGMATNEEIEQLQGMTETTFDVYFLQLMIRHHQGGVPMAKYASEKASTPVVRRLALEMLESQGDETEMMTRMLRERGGHPLPLCNE